MGLSPKLRAHWKGRDEDTKRVSETTQTHIFSDMYAWRSDGADVKMVRFMKFSVIECVEALHCFMWISEMLVQVANIGLNSCSWKQNVNTRNKVAIANRSMFESSILFTTANSFRLFCCLAFAHLALAIVSAGQNNEICLSYPEAPFSDFGNNHNTTWSVCRIG